MLKLEHVVSVIHGLSTGVIRFYEHIKFLAEIRAHDLRCRQFYENIVKECIVDMGKFSSPIVIIPILSIDNGTNRTFIKSVSRVVYDTFKYKTIIGDYILTKEKNIDGDIVIDRVKKNGLISQCSKIIVVTDLDIFSKNHKWMYGYAEKAYPCCIVSIKRLNSRLEHSFKELAKITIHEIGHTFGLDHCIYESCVMHDVPDAGISAMSMHFCSTCRLQILQIRKNIIGYSE